VRHGASAVAQPPRGGSIYELPGEYFSHLRRDADGRPTESRTQPSSPDGRPPSNPGARCAPDPPRSDPLRRRSRSGLSGSGLRSAAWKTDPPRLAHDDGVARLRQWLRRGLAVARTHDQARGGGAGGLRAWCRHRLGRRGLPTSLANQRQRRPRPRRAGLPTSRSRRFEVAPCRPVRCGSYDRQPLPGATPTRGAGRADPVDSERRDTRQG
jgi:hypothetical protein